MKFILGILSIFLFTSPVLAIAPYTEIIPPVERIENYCEIYTSDAIEGILESEFSLFEKIEGNGLERYDEAYGFTDKTNSVLIMLISKGSCVIDIYVVERN